VGFATAVEVPGFFAQANEFFAILQFLVSGNFFTNPICSKGSIVLIDDLVVNSQEFEPDRICRNFEPYRVGY
jgi:hypothetical protein